MPAEGPKCDSYSPTGGETSAGKRLRAARRGGTVSGWSGRSRTRGCRDWRRWESGQTSAGWSRQLPVEHGRVVRRATRLDGLDAPGRRLDGSVGPRGRRRRAAVLRRAERPRDLAVAAAGPDRAVPRLPAAGAADLRQRLGAVTHL